MENATNSRADLHLHTNFSDGTYSPKKVVSMAVKKGLGAIAITDHDSIGGVEPARTAAIGTPLEVVSGAELSSYIGDRGYHIVGLFIDINDGRLNEHLEFFRNHRYRRGEEIIEKLNGLGIKITIDDVLEISGSGSLGRPHIAEALHRVGAVNSVQESFDRYIGNGRPAYVPKFQIDPGKAAEIIHAAGGVAIMAHPGISARSEKEIREVMSMGMDGIETVHAKHDPEQVRRFTKMATSEGWLMSGGSDSHGEHIDHSEIGSFSVNIEYLEKIRNHLAK